MTEYNIHDLTHLLGPHDIVGSGSGVFTETPPFEKAKSSSLIWVSPAQTNCAEVISSTQAAVVVCHSSTLVQPRPHQVFVQVADPKIAFVRILREIVPKPDSSNIHCTAIIHEEAMIHDSVSIGPFCYIGKCSIGANTLIESHCRISDNCEIGKNVIIQSGCIIGEAGFGFAQESDGTWIRFPHIGGVSIGDDVEIGSNTCIDSGALGATTIGRGTKIDNLVHIGHNATIGSRCIITACAQIGAVNMGDDVWVGPNANLLRGQSIGNKAFISVGSVVTRDVPEGKKGHW
jgi:UDP-3-O-[3-hydroxymyristoyl] glucosamine N-acyltransferase